MRHIIIFVIFVVGVVSILSKTDMFKEGRYKGKGYTIMFPEGWSDAAKKKKKSVREILFPQKPEQIVYASPEKDLDDIPLATISVLTRKLEQALWIEDSFHEVNKALKTVGMIIMDQGDIDISGKRSKWILYRDAEWRRMNLEFYLITDNNVLYKIQYSTDPDAFNKYRPTFEKTRETFKLDLFA